MFTCEKWGHQTDTPKLSGGSPHFAMRERIPCLRDAETIRRLVAELKHPVNILAVPGSPSIPELEKLGVARVSLGSGTMRAALGVLAKITQELKSTGTYASLEGAPSHAELNRLMRLSPEDDPH